MRVLFIILSSFFLLNGCANPYYNVDELKKQLYNVPSVTHSKFDNMTVIRMGHIICPSFIMFELYQDSRQAEKDIVILSAGLMYAENIDNGTSLHIKLDGKVSSFKSSDVLTTHENLPIPIDSFRPFSYKKFIIPENYIRQIAMAHEVLVKIDLLKGAFSEGECSNIELQEHDNPLFDAEENAYYRYSIGQNGFREFVRLIDSNIH